MNRSNIILNRQRWFFVLDKFELGDTPFKKDHDVRSHLVTYICIYFLKFIMVFNALQYAKIKC